MADNYDETVVQSVRDVLRYSVINLHDATETIGGFPYGNAKRIYRGSANDLLLNLLVARTTADPIAAGTDEHALCHNRRAPAAARHPCTRSAISRCPTSTSRCTP
jgi:hypothetical protein